MKQYTKDGLSPNTFAVLIANLTLSSLHEYVVNGSTSVVNGEIITYHPINQHLLSILKYLSTTEPITGIFQFPILNEAELLLVVDLAAGIPANIKQIEMLYKKTTNLKSLFQSYELEVLPSELVRLHPLVSALLVTIMEKVEHLYARKYPRRPCSC